MVVPLSMSFGRSAERIWRLVNPGNDIVLALAALALVGLAWCLVLCWWVIWAVALVPYRLITRPRRGAQA
jgi:hypothetical protein